MLRMMIVILLLGRATLVSGFVTPQGYAKHIQYAPVYDVGWKGQQIQQMKTQQMKVRLNAANDDNNKEADVDNFDGKGFAGYLAPYAVALIGSIAVTAAFVKFVLLDY